MFVSRKRLDAIETRLSETIYQHKKLERKTQDLIDALVARGIIDVDRHKAFGVTMEAVVGGVNVAEMRKDLDALYDHLGVRWAVVPEHREVVKDEEEVAQ
jgi:polyhydroxyalkanoate synthesis regulator phasin